MKKQSQKKNRLLWIVLACILVVIAAVITVTVILSSDQGEQETVPTTEATQPVQDQQTVEDDTMKIYWNVDAKTYRAQTMVRHVDEEGLIYITFSVEGEQVRLPVDNMTLANKIDMLDLMGLVFNEDGIVVDAVRVEEFTGGLAANRYYVTDISDGVVTCNSSVSLRGFESRFQITEDTPVWNVGGSGVIVGIASQLAVEDEVIAVKDMDGNISEVFKIPYQEPGDVYWNVERKYDSTSKLTTRTPDMLGSYAFTLALNGEQVTVYTKDMKIASSMDSYAAKCFSLEFDEEGYVTKVSAAADATGGSSCASWYHCTSINGSSVGFTRIISPNAGLTYSGTLSKNCKVYDVSGMGAYVGEPTELRVTDQVHCLTDSRGQICLIFVVGRMAESEMYWNVERMWDSTTSLTTRTPDADGWYRITVAVRGEQKVVKTQDPEIAQKIDARAAKCFGLKLEGDVIVEFYTPDAVTGGGTFASWYNITALEGNSITVYKTSTGDTKTGTIASDCEIYNVSSTATMVGEVTELQVGDLIHSVKNLNGQVCVIYVVTRYEDLPVYWNITRKYDSTNKVSTRTRAEDGYFYFEMAYNGKTVTVKTADQKIANTIDSQAAKCVAMDVRNGIVYKAIHPSSAAATKGGPTSSWCYVTSVSSSGFSTKKLQNGEITMTYDETYAAGCKIYNVSSTATVKGEVTTLQVGDLVHCLKDSEGNVCYAYVITRYEDLDIYYNRTRKWNSTKECTTRTPNADGLYEFEMAYGGKAVTLYTASLDVANAIDYEVAKCLALDFDSNGLIVRAMHAKNTQDAKGGPVASYTYVTGISGSTVNTTKNSDGTGAATTFTMAADCKVINVSTLTESHWGEYTTLKVDDYIHCLANGDGKVAFIYVMSRQLPRTTHTCQQVTENVQWYAWNGETISKSGHYVLSSDCELSQRITISSGVNATVCLNGHTITSADRFFNISGTLTICDHKQSDGTYHGKLSSAYSNGTKEDGSVSAAYASIAYLYNKDSNAVLNIYGGTLESTGTLTNGGLLYLGNSSIATAGVATVNLYDGVLTGGNTTGTGGGVNIANGSVFNMYGGTVTGCTSAQNGGGVNVDTGTFNMTGGTLTGNTAAEGGNLRISRNGTANISGSALLTNGNAKTGGSVTMFGVLNFSGNARIAGTGTTVNVFCNYSNAVCEVNILGGTIEGTIRYGSNKGSVTMNILGGTVDTVNYQDSSVTSLYVGGSPKVSKLQIADGKTLSIHKDGLNDSASIAISMVNDVPAFSTTISDSKDAACFAPYDPTVYKVINQDNKLYLMPLILHEHCICGENVTVDGHSCATQRWTVWNDPTSLPASGNIFLNTDVTLSAAVKIVNNTTLNICLNGHTITGKTDGTARVFNVYGTLNLADCTGTGKVISSYTNGTKADGSVDAKYGGIFYIYNSDGDATFNLYGGELTATGTLTNGGVGYVGNSSADTAGKALFNMYGGSVTQGQATGNGGGIFISNQSTFNMYGGTVTGCATAGSGGGVNVDSGTFNMTGGTLIGNSATGEGGNMRINRYGTVSLSGSARVENGVAKNGGNITMFGKLSVSENAVITGGRVTGVGSAISVFCNYDNVTCTVDILGGTVDGTVRYGSNKGSVTMNILGGTVDTVDYQASSVTSLYVGGTANIGLLKLADGKTVQIHGDGLEDTASIVITMNNSELPFTTVTDAGDEACFRPSDEAVYEIRNVDNDLYLVSKYPTHIHCACSGVAEGKEGHTICESLTYQPWTDPNSLPASGNYFLVTDVTTDTVSIAANTTLNLCLNGYDVTGTARIFSIRGVLNLSDCDTDCGVITGNTAHTTANGGIFYLYKDGTFNFFGGTMADAEVTGEGGIGCVAGGTGSIMNMYGGTVSGGKATTSGKTGGNVVIWDGASLNVYGGTITGGYSSGGGNVNIAKGTMTVHEGATIEKGVSAGYGGNIRVAAGYTLKITGGIIQDGTAASGGGNLYGNSSSTAYAQIYISGGTVTGGKITGTGTGAGILCYGDVYLSGAPVISGNGTNNLRVGARDLQVIGGGMTEGAEVYVYIDYTDLTQPMATAIQESDAQYFHSDKSDYVITYADGYLYASLEETPVAAHTHCVCGGTDGDHDHADTTEWTEWPEANSLPASGTYCLSTDVQLSAALRIEANTTLNLCLNGHKITSKTDGSARVFNIYGNLNLTDCQKNADGTYKGTVESYYANSDTTSRYGGVFYIYNSNTNPPIFNMYGGNLVMVSTESLKAGGVGYVGNTSTGPVGEFNLYAGTLTGGKVTSTGGALEVSNKCQINIYGGTITGNAVTGTASSTNYASGGAIMIVSGTVHLYGGTVTGNSANGSGGNIDVRGSGALYIYEGAEVSDGESTGNTAGNINLRESSSRLYMYGGKVSGGTSASGKAAGSINLMYGEAEITGGTITGGIAGGECGNIRIGGDAKLTLGGNAVVENGYGTSGGNIGVFGTLIIQDNAIIRGGETSGRGGNISVYANLASANASITMTGGTITGGSAGISGAAVRLEGKDGTVSFTMTGGKIETGTATLAPGVYAGVASGSGSITVTLGGTAQIDDLYLASGQKILLSEETPLAAAEKAIKISAASEGIVAENVTAQAALCFGTAVDGWSVVYDETQKTLSCTQA